MKLIQLTLITLMVMGSPGVIAQSAEHTIAKEMAYAVVANRCTDEQNHTIEVTFETGVRMASNKSQLNKLQVLKIVNQASTIAQADRIISQLENQLKSGQQNCNALMTYVLDGIMPSYVAQQK